MENVQEELEIAKRSIAELRAKVDIFIVKLWDEIRFLCSGQEPFQLIQAKVQGTWKVTKLEEAELILDELVTLVNTKEEVRTGKVYELEAELEALKRHNTALKREIRDNLEEAEKLDRENEELRKVISLGGSPGTVRKLCFEDIQEANNKIRELQGKLRLATQEKQLNSEDNLFHKEPKLSVERKKMSGQDIFKTIKALVPTFGGEPSQNLQMEVHKFIDGCRLAAKGVPSEEVGNFLDIVKQRLYGDAYQLVRLRTFSSVEEFVQLIRVTYLKTRSLDSVLRELYDAAQRGDEDVRQFARRLQTLSSTADMILKETYGGKTDEIMRAEIEKKLKASFTAGLRDPMLRGRMLASTASNLDDLLREAIDAQSMLWRGEDHPRGRVCYNESFPSPGDDPVTGLVAIVEKLLKEKEGVKPQPAYDRDRSGAYVFSGACSFCNRMGHTRDVCFERRNSPYCGKCKEYGHEEKPSCRNKERTKGATTGWFKGCYSCGVVGHYRRDCPQAVKVSGNGPNHRFSQPREQ